MVNVHNRHINSLYRKTSFPGIGGAAYLLYLSRSLAATCGTVCLLLWLVALRYGAFQRRSQRLYQNFLADTNQARAGSAVNPGYLCGERKPANSANLLSRRRWSP